MIQQIGKELELRKDYLPDRNLETIYFGGGTPSLLTEEEIGNLFNTISKHFTIAPNAEVTIETNPDDLNEDKLSFLSNYFNRLSIGIQSFYEPHLRYMNRAHSAKEARTSVLQAQDAGFNNISIDLIYGISHPHHSVWENDLQTAIQLNIQHLSSYCLTIEPGTVFGTWLRKNKILEAPDDFSARQFEYLIQYASQSGFQQYEISNFCKPGLYSRHNSSYWQGKAYLGLGPSAHSFNGTSRQFNVAHNKKYMDALLLNKLPFEHEELSKKDCINEYIMTGIRTIWGINVKHIQEHLGYPFEEQLKKIAVLQKEGFVNYNEDCISLTVKGKLIADKITRDLFLIKDI